MLPEGNTLSSRSYEANKILCPMDLDYIKINACHNDCILYRKEHENLKECPRCGESHYKKKANGVEGDDSVTRKSVFSKVLWYLQLIQRFKRLFANANDAKKY